MIIMKNVKILIFLISQFLSVPLAKQGNKLG